MPLLSAALTVAAGAALLAAWTRVLSRVIEDRGAALAAGLGCTLASAIVMLQLAARATSSVTLGVPVAAVLAVVAATIVLRRVPAAAPGTARDLRPIVSGACAALLVLPIAVRWHFHDELLPTGHLAITEQMRNCFPPRHLTFPDVVLNYHYGCDLLAAALRETTPLATDAAVDAVTILAAFVLGAVGWAIGERAAGAAGGAVTAALLLLGSGAEWTTRRFIETPTVETLVGNFEFNGWKVNPGLLSYHFQHPWGLAAPLLATAFLLIGHAQRSSARRAALLVVVAALAVAQAPSFALAILAVGVAGALDAGADGRRAWLREGAWLIAAVAVAWSMRGSLSVGYDAEAPLHRFTSGLLLGVRPDIAMRWLLASIGVPLLIGWAGFRRHGRAVAPLTFAAIAATITPLFVAYRNSWDVVKFTTIAQHLLCIGAAPVIVDQARRGGVRRLIAGASLAACIATSVAIATVLVTAPVEKVPIRFHSGEPGVLTGDDASVVEWLRRRAAPGELVWRSRPMAAAYAQAGGLPVLVNDRMAVAFGFSTERVVLRKELLATQPEDLAPWTDAGVRWFVVDPQDVQMSERTSAWAAQGRVERAFAVGALVVWRTTASR